MNIEAEVASAVGAIDLDQEQPDSASGNPDNSSESTNSKTNTPRKSSTPSLSASSSETVSDCSDRLSLDSQAQSDATATNENQRKASTVSLDLVVSPEVDVYSGRKNISWFIILEDMGQGAYGQVKLAQYKPPRQEVVLKYVIKKRILVDTWIRDRKIGTLPLEIHVLKYLQSYPHKNVVDMLDYFEDELNYYIEMAPHGIPGMDLFDYIELRTEMDEDECRSIFFQVASAIYHLHKVGVVHRDIKDENIILDGDGNIKLIDFGSAAYIKNGPFSVFVGTIDYAAPEVLRGQLYSGMEQDVWAAGILLYTIIYKENPFYDGTEIMNAELRIPHIMSEESVTLIKKMLSRNISERPTMEEVMNDPWLRGCQTESEENTSSPSEASTAPAS
ncbi:kinase-like domain-containing protein [Myxozyma melibiosi]|uniref:Kinase-like domain-containing protein n=1 Tax=Myxozyma melibiosi TaxID=54550 RepID=A0ABR1FDQ9_9ASCO